MRRRYIASVQLYKPGGKKKWVTVGAGFELDSGQINLVMDTLPIDPSQWNGTICLFPPTGREDEPNYEENPD